MNRSSLSQALARWHFVTGILVLSTTALLACGPRIDGGGDGGGGAGGNGAGGDGAGASTSTVTPGCPDDLSESLTGEPCAPVGQKCGGPPTHCLQSTHMAFCQDDGTWVVFHYDSYCMCPSDLPVAGEACDPDWVWPTCEYPTTADCGAATILATCEPDASGANTWHLTDPACP